MLVIDRKFLILKFHYISREARYILLPGTSYAPENEDNDEGFDDHEPSEPYQGAPA